MPQDILITPNKNSSTTQGKIDFTGKGASASTITLKVLDDSTLSFEGTAGQLFSITPVLASGTIFSVNDVSGVPMIDVDASGLVRLAPLGGTVYSNTLYAVPRTVAGSGNSVTIRAADGLTSGAGGSVVLQPGVQATTGGNGSIEFKDTSGVTRSYIQNTSFILGSSGGTDGNIAGLGTSDVSFTGNAGYFRTLIALGSGATSAYLSKEGASGQNIIGVKNWQNTDGSSFAYKSSSPTSFSANQNDLALSSSAFQRLSSSAAYNLTGIAPPANGAHVDGRVIWLHNVGSFNITLKHSQSSVAGNQFINENGGDIVLGPNRIVQCTYDGTSTKWRVHGEMYPYNLPTADGTSGQVLSTNGSGTLSWTTASGGLGGSGTTNYIVKFTGSTTAGNSQIFDNGTNVGIGTASPNSKVTIGADFASITGMTIDTGNGTDSGLVMRKAASKTAMGFLPWDSDAYITAGVYYDGGAWVHHNANNNNQLFVMSPGTGISWYASNNGTGSWNVANGITLWNDAGTWRQPVDAVGTGGSTVNALGTALIRVSPSSQNTYAALELRTLNAGTYGGAGLMAVNDTNYDSNLVFYTNPAGSTTRAERMRIHKNGDIGIAVGGKIAQGLGFAGNAGATSYNYIDLYNGTTGELGLRTVGSFPLICYTANTERMRIDSSGNVGIGSNTSAYRLKVQSSGSSALQLTSAGATIGGPTVDLFDSTHSTEAVISCISTGIALGAYSNHPLFFLVNATERMRIDTSGNVGVGATSVGAKLHVEAGAAGTKGLLVKAAATPTANIVEVQNSSGTNLVYVDPTGDLVVGSLSAGTFPTGALAPLHVTRSTTAVSTAIAAWPTAEPETQTHARVVAYMSDGGNGGTATVGTGTTNIVQFGEYYTGRVVLMPLGAGSGTPADQNSGAGRDIMLLGGKSDNSAGKTGGRVFIQGGTGFAGAYGTNFGDVVLQANGGRVGIGTTSPSSTLDIRASTTNSGIGQLMITAPSSGDNRFAIGFHTSSSYGFLNAYQNSIGGYPIILQQYFDARVGIGNITSPGAKLEIVSGTNTTKGLIVKGAASQSATLQEWQNNGGTALASVGSDGGFSSSGAGYFAGKLTGTTTFNLMRDGYVVGSSSRICAAYYIPTTANSYLEMVKIVSAEPLIIRLRTYADGQKQQREYEWIYTGDSSPTGILKPVAEIDNGGSEKYVIEFVRVASFDFRIRARRTAGSAVGLSVYGVLDIVSRYGADYYITDVSGTGTSSVSNYLSDQYYNIAPSTIRSAPPVLGSGAGENLTIQASSGAGTGAGGSIILQPGLQATSGGNGIVAVRQPSGTAGTDEIQLSHDGIKGSIINKDGTLQLGGANIAIRNTANNGGTTVTATTLYAANIYSSDGVNADGVCNSSYSWGIDSSSLSWNQSLHIRASWAHIAGYGGAGIAYTGNNSNGRYATLEITDGSSNGGSLAYRSTDHSITANTNDLTPVRYSGFQRWSSTGNFNVTGLAPGATTSFSGGTPTWIHTNGRVIWIHNVGSYNITLKHEDANSTAANRFTNESGTDLIMPPNSAVMLTYDGTTTRWRVDTLSKVVTNSSSTTNISTATNNLVLSGSNFQRLNCTTACNLTGVAPPTGSSTHYDGRTMRIYNTGTANLTLKHNSTSSDIANRFCCVQAVDIILAPRDFAELIYDGTDGGLVAGQNNPCWRVH